MLNQTPSANTSDPRVLGLCSSRLTVGDCQGRPRRLLNPDKDPYDEFRLLDDGRVYLPETGEHYLAGPRQEYCLEQFEPGGGRPASVRVLVCKKAEEMEAAAGEAGCRARSRFLSRFFFGGGGIGPNSFLV